MIESIESVERYLRLNQELIAVQNHDKEVIHDMKSEDEIMDEMEKVWYELSEDEMNYVWYKLSEKAPLYWLRMLIDEFSQWFQQCIYRLWPRKSPSVPRRDNESRSVPLWDWDWGRTAAMVCLFFCVSAYIGYPYIVKPPTLVKDNVQEVRTFNQSESRGNTSSPMTKVTNKIESGGSKNADTPKNLPTHAEQDDLRVPRPVFPRAPFAFGAAFLVFAILYISRFVIPYIYHSLYILYTRIKS